MTTWKTVMPIIQIKMVIEAPIDRCFDLSRSIDLHKISTSHTGEEAIGGVTSGLIGLSETVTWRARHFGIRQTLTTRITELDYPNFFVDKMVKGAFKRFRHEHHFKDLGGKTEMRDYFDYESPLGILGRMFDFVVLRKYMQDLLEQRNLVIKEYAESDKWKKVLSDPE
ncbi:SRPBCC family protein [uncultured Imperialibacter sp.]|uniref:SRPBCC family protein n=1 Tax=uncultured Imperialibacter sp. TaxID=1672639 RepID=UPI0030D8A4B7